MSEPAENFVFCEYCGLIIGSVLSSNPKYGVCGKCEKEYQKLKKFYERLREELRPEVVGDG